MQNPQLKAQYLGEYYTQTLDGKKTTAEVRETEAKAMKAEIESILAKATMNDKIREAKADVEKKLMDIEKGKVDVEKGRAEIYDTLVQAGLRKYMAETSRISANASSTSAAASYQNAQTNKGKLALDQDQFKYEKDPTNPNNLLKFSTINKNSSDSSLNADMNKLIQDPEGFGKVFDANRQMFLDTYGPDGFKKLESELKARTKNSDW